MLAVVAVLFLVLLRLAYYVFRHNNAGVDQNTNGDGDAAKAHDVRRDTSAAHEEECSKHRERQWDCDNKNAAEMPQKEHVRQRDQHDLFDECMAESVYGVVY